MSGHVELTFEFATDERGARLLKVPRFGELREAFRAATGSDDDRVLANLLGLMELTNRITALAHFSVLNDQEDNDGFNQAATRNRTAIVLMSIGYMREVSAVVDRLSGAGLKAKLKGDGLEAWEELRKLGKRSGYRQMRDVRNQVAFHIDEPTLLAGIAALDPEDEVVIAAGDTEKAGHWQFDLATTALLHGQGWLVDGATEESLPDFVAQLADDQRALGGLVQRVFFSLLGVEGMGEER